MSQQNPNIGARKNGSQKVVAQWLEKWKKEWREEVRRPQVRPGAQERGTRKEERVKGRTEIELKRTRPEEVGRAQVAREEIVGQEVVG